MATSGQGRGGGRGGAQRGNRPPTAKDQERARLREISQETLKILPQIRELTPQHSTSGFLISDPDPPRLDQQHCPGFRDVKVQVVEEDTMDAAISLISSTGAGDPAVSTSSKGHDAGQQKEPEAAAGSMAERPCILNMASERHPGGGWLSGARAQEEALSRRSTLTCTLSPHFYPLPAQAAVYSPSVVVFRASIFRQENPHGMYDLRRVDDLPVVSVVSMPALRRPAVQEVSVVNTASGNESEAAGSSATRVQKYKNPADRELMKEKMRRVLRICAWKGHTRIVLGALGCGAFANPREEAALCWKEVFAEPEFGGGWWSCVLFAVVDETGMGKAGDGNVGVFARTLDGLDVGGE